MEGFEFRLRGGKILGRDHARAGKNCQDGYFAVTYPNKGKYYWIGVVSDGCSEGKNSEIAGILLPNFIVGQVIHLLDYQVPLSKIPMVLYPAAVRFLRGLMELFPVQSASFVENHLLATVLGFIVNEEEGIIFHAGDGLYLINDDFHEIDYANRSPYLGYHLVHPAHLENPNLPRTFSTIQVETGGLARLAITSDGFSKNLLGRLMAESHEVPLGIQLWINWINGPRNPEPQKGLFYDDASVVLLERVEGEADD